ncbi:MAG: chemotaxis protein CheW [Proteobacteria bacterium]|nr:chemotaxis protein CheW [Pseudomonadota bacterium]MBU1610552.1 chemotaxis protein CheW [Pseudomonadota bacterium]
MINSIRQSIEELQQNILDLEQGKAVSGQVLDSLGLTHLKMPSAQIIALLDMLADGITPINPDIVSSLLSLCESYKQLFYVLAGRLEFQASKLAKVTPKSETTEVVSAPVPLPETEPEPEPEPAEQAKAATPSQQAKAQNINSIRVDTVRLDRLIEHVGKLMVTYAVISQAGSNNMNKVSSSLRELDIVISNLQGEVDAIRLVPLKQIFMPMHRLIKSLSQKVSKKMDFVITGDDLALDKSIVECLNEPLVHLLRNAVDHGLETTEERADTTKDPIGLVSLTAERKGETAYIHIKDDGKGLDPAKIRAKAVEKGIIGPEEELSDQESYQLIMRSGFSTAAAVTDISGRGVGMDAVLNVIKNQLDGEITIKSELGKGSVFTLAIPLSRSANEGIVEALICRLGSERFIIPSQDVVEIYIPTLADLVQLPDGRETVDVRGRLHTLIRLNDHLDIEADFDDITLAQTVVVRVGDIRAAILVSEVLRQQQVVITKFTVPVEDIYHLPLLGYGMMGESDALVVDTEALLRGMSDIIQEKQSA